MPICWNGIYKIYRSLRRYIDVDMVSAKDEGARGHFRLAGLKIGEVSEDGYIQYN